MAGTPLIGVLALQGDFEAHGRMLRGLARAYLRSFPEEQRRTIAVRFDVVSVYGVGVGAEFDVMQGAFGWR